MDLNMQAKLLRLLKKKDYTNRQPSIQKMNVRIIAVINEDPRDCLLNNTIRKIYITDYQVY